MNQKQRTITAVFAIVATFLTFLVSCLLTAADHGANIGTSPFLDRFNQPVWEAQSGDITLRETRNTALGRSYIELEVGGETIVLDIR